MKQWNLGPRCFDSVGYLCMDVQLSHPPDDPYRTAALVVYTRVLNFEFFALNAEDDAVGLVDADTSPVA